MFQNYISASDRNSCRTSSDTIQTKLTNNASSVESHIYELLTKFQFTIQSTLNQHEPEKS